MRSRNRSLKEILFLAIIACAAYGCGGGLVTETSLPIIVSVSPATATVQAGGTEPLSATVQNDSENKGVTWVISPATGAGMLVNREGTSATYSAPPTAPTSDLTVTITATSLANPSKSATAKATVPAITLTLTEFESTIIVNTALTYTANVNNDPTHQGVNWALTQNGVSCSPGCGNINPTNTASGKMTTYTAPPTIPANATVTLTATSMTDTSKSAVGTVTIVPPPPISIILPPSASTHVNGTVLFQAGVANDPNNAGVIWSISGCAGGAAVCGSITNVNNAGPFTADYVAPATVPSGGQVSVVATSVTDPTKSASATVTVSAIDFTTHNYSAGNAPNGVAVGDFNGDGKLDIAVADYGNPATGDNGGVSILLGNGDGTFQPAISVNAGKNPISIAVGDFNNDGKTDLVLADYGDRQSGGNGAVEILLGNGDGTFQSPITLSAGNEPFPLAVGDFNGDGKLDFAVTDFNSGVYLFVGNGDGSFQVPALISAGLNPVAIVVSDFNKDGKLDLAVADLHDPSSNDNGGISILVGKGDGTFETPVFYAVGLFPTSIAVGDLNGDGKPDLAVSTFAASFGLEVSSLNVLPGNGDGTFAGYISTFTGHAESGSVFPLSVVIAAFNPSGKPSVAEVQRGVVSVLPGNGDGTFQGKLLFGADQLPFQLAVGDFNGDGKPDIVVANQGSNDVTILLNVTGP